MTLCKIKKKKNFMCNVCKKTIINKKHFNRHKKEHENRKFECKLCDKIFKRQQHLRHHMLFHTKVKAYKCPICKKKFSRKDNMLRHLLQRYNYKKNDNVVYELEILTKA